MKRLNTILLLLGLSAIVIFAMGGCSSDDGVTPHEDPVITAEDAAGQSAFVAVAMSEVLQQLASKASPDLRTMNTDYAYGQYWKDDDPEYRVYTDADYRIYVNFSGEGGDPFDPNPDHGVVTFDITSVEDVANGTGNLNTSAGTVTYTVVDVLIESDNHPAGGQLIASTGDFTATVEFFADHTAEVVVGARTWMVDLDTGDIDEII